MFQKMKQVANLLQFLIKEVGNLALLLLLGSIWVFIIQPLLITGTDISLYKWCYKLVHHENEISQIAVIIPS